MMPTTIARPVMGGTTATGFGHDAGLLSTRTPQVTKDNSPAASVQVSIHAVFQELDELATLEADWDGDDALPIDQTALAWARAFMKALAEYSEMRGYASKIPEVAPTAEGGVSFSWNVSGSSFLLLIHPNREEMTFISKLKGAFPVRKKMTLDTALGAICTGLGNL